MSFILDALRKAERQRRGEPRGGILGPPPSRERRRAGLWVLVAVLAVLNAVGWSLVTLRGRPAAPSSATGTPGSPPLHGGDAPGLRAQASGTSSGDEVTRRRLVWRPEASGPADPAPLRDLEARSSPLTAREEPTPRPAPPGSRGRQGREPSTPGVRTTPGLVQAPAQRAPTAPAGAAQIGAARPDRDEPSPTQGPRGPSGPTSPISAASPVGSAPASASSRSRAAAPGVGQAELPASFREALGRLRLEVLVDAEDPRHREVFINGRRYRAGDRLDDDIVVEEIVSEGVRLSWQGHQAWLRHARPP